MKSKAIVILMIFSLLILVSSVSVYSDYPPIVNSISATGNSLVNITTNVTDIEGNLSTVIVEINSPSSVKTNYTMSLLNGDIYNKTYYPDESGQYSYAIYGIDAYGNVGLGNGIPINYIGYFPMDTDTLGDSVLGDMDGTVTGAVLNTTFYKAGDASYHFIGSNSNKITYTNYSFTHGLSKLSYCMWATTEVDPADSIFLALAVSDHAFLGFGGQIKSRMYINSAETVVNDGIPVNNYVWYYICNVYNGTSVKLYRNGTLSGTPKSASGLTTQTRFEFGWDTVGVYHTGFLDEAVFYSQALTDSEIMSLYNNDGVPSNSGFGSFTVDVEPPSVTGISAIGDTIIDINANVTDDVMVYSVIVEVTKPSSTKTNYTMSLLSGDTYNKTYYSDEEGIYYYKIYASDNSSNVNDSVIGSFSTIFPPVVTLVSPYDNDHNFLNLTVVSSCTDIGYTGLSMTLYVNGSVSSVTNSSVNDSVNTYLTTDDMFTDGSYSWYINCTDGISYTLSETRTYVLDTTPPILTVLSPVNNSWHEETETIWINISGEDPHIYLLNYTIYNESGVVKQSNQAENGSLSTYISINDTIDISFLGFKYGDKMYINISTSDAHTGKGIFRNLTFSYSNGTITFFKKNNVKKNINLDFGEYKNGNIHKLNNNDISNMNLNQIITKTEDRYMFGASFELPDVNYEFGFRFPRAPGFKLFNPNTAHFILYNEYWLDFDLYLIINGVEYQQHPNIGFSPNYYEIYWIIDWSSYGLQAGDNVTLLTKSIGGLNIVEKTYVINVGVLEYPPVITVYSPSTHDIDVSVGETVDFDIEVFDNNTFDLISYIWSVDSSPVSTSEDLSYTIPSGPVGRTYDVNVTVYDNSYVNYTDSEKFILTVVSGRHPSYGLGDFSSIVIDGIGTAGASFITYIDIIIVILVLVFIFTYFKLGTKK